MVLLFVIQLMEKRMMRIGLEVFRRGMTSETYQSIFAFSAMDLRDLHMMNDEDIGEMLLGIGLTGSKNIHAIEKDLDKQIGELFKPYGTKPVINKQLEKLTRVKEELAKWQSKEGTYAEEERRVLPVDQSIA